MKIAILTSGILPVPAVQGGAVENLVDFYLDYNDRHHLHDITVYSIANSAAKKHIAQQSTVNHYYYVDVNSPMAKIQKRIQKHLAGNNYYHYTIEYFLSQALKHIRKQHYDLILLENRPGYALRLVGHTDIPIVYHLHNDFLNADTPNGPELYAAAHRIISVSDFITRQVMALDANSQKCVTVYNGINLQAFNRNQAEPVSRAQLKLRDTDFVIVYSGRINRDKGIDQLIQAMHLISEYSDIKLLVIGSSFYGNSQAGTDPFIEELKEAARPLKDRIIFTGFIPYKNMPAYLSLADCAAVPSQWNEPFGLTCLEAMAMGLPVITTDMGALPEIAGPDNAIIIPTNKSFVSKLAVAILDLYSHKERRQQMGEASHARALRFDKDRYAEEFFQALCEIQPHK